MSSNFERLHEIIKQAYAENFIIPTQKMANPLLNKSISSFPNRIPFIQNCLRLIEMYKTVQTCSNLIKLVQTIYSCLNCIFQLLWFFLYSSIRTSWLDGSKHLQVDEKNFEVNSLGRCLSANQCRDRLLSTFQDLISGTSSLTSFCAMGSKNIWSSIVISFLLVCLFKMMFRHLVIWSRANQCRDCLLSTFECIQTLHCRQINVPFVF